MRIDRWQIWHDYATYCALEREIDLDRAARRLTKTGVAELVFSPPGHIWYRRAGTIEAANLEINKTPFEAHAEFTLPPNIPDYAGECAYQAAFMFTQERHLVSDPGGTLPEYMRIFLAPCYLVLGQAAVALYPQVKFFGNGVMLTQLRVMSSEHPLTVEEFIRNQVNLYRRVGDDLRVPSPVFTQYIRSLLLRGGGALRSRIGAVETLELVQHWISKTEGSEEEELGNWPMVNLSDFPDVESERDLVPLTLRHIARMIQLAVLEAVGSPRYGLPYLALGSGRRVIPLGSFWTGRPSVHLVDFEGQPEAASGLSDEVRNGLAQVMMRSEIPVTAKDPSVILGSSTRAFDDFLVFQARGISAWVSMKSDLAPGRGFPEDPNFNYLVLAKQVQVEVVDYLHIATRRIHDRSLAREGSLGQILSDERELLVLEQGIGEVSAMGEVQDFIRQGEECLGLGEIRQRTRDAMRLKSSAIEEHKNRIASRFGSLLTIVFGLMGAPAVQAGVTDPALRMLGWDLPGSQDAQTILAFCIACVVVVAVVFGVYGLLAGLTRRRR